MHTGMQDPFKLIERADSQKVVQFGSLGSLVVEMLVIVDDPLLSQVEAVLLDKKLFENFTYLAGHSDVQTGVRANSLDFIEFSSMLQQLGLMEDGDNPASHDSKSGLSSRSTDTEIEERSAVLDQIEQRLNREQAASVFRCAIGGKAANAKMSVAGLGGMNYKKYCVAARQVGSLICMPNLNIFTM